MLNIIWVELVGRAGLKLERARKSCFAWGIINKPKHRLMLRLRRAQF